MTGTTEQNIDLAGAFRSVNQVLIENKATLNEADTVNHDHGDNMVQTFKTIASAMSQKSNAPADQQMEYAAQVLRQTATNASSQIYADGLQNAAAQFKGKPVTRGGAMDLISALMGINTGSAQGQQSQGGGMGDLLGSLMGGSQPASQQPQGGDMGDLLGSLLGGTQQQAPQQSQGGDMGDLLGSLLGGTQQAPQQSQGGGMGDLLGSLLGGTQQAPQQSQGAVQGNKPGLDLMTLLQYGLGYIQATQAGKTPLQALVQVLLTSGSKMGSRDYRAQSGALVMQTLAQALGAAQ